MPSDRDAIHDLLSAYVSYYAAATSASSSYVIPLEWEFRFSSFRVFNARFAHDFRLLFDEYASAVTCLQRYGWKMDGSAQQFKRWVVSSDNASSITRITEFEKGKFTMEYKTAYLAVKTTAMKDLDDIYHVRTSLQQEKMETSLTQQDIRNKRDAAVHDGTVHLREITRTSFIHPEFPSLRIDFSDISSTSSASSSRTRSYEIELEVLPKQLRLLTAQKIVDAIRQIIIGIQFGTFGIISGQRWKQTATELNDCLMNAQLRFPQPISISSIHLSSIIRGEFAVTEKADGKRCLLFLSSSRRELFRIDFYGRIISLGMQLPENLHQDISSFLLDAEFIEDKNIYLIFDIYLFEGTSYWLPVSEHIHAANQRETGRLTFHSISLMERYKVLNSVLAKCASSWFGKGKTTVVLQLKNMVFPSGTNPTDNRAMFEFIHGIVHKTVTFPYKVEGLLFTHLRTPLPVNGSMSSSFVLPVNTTLTCARWNGAIKYKPPEETTNDFQLGSFQWDDDSKTVFIPLYCYVPSTAQLALFEGILPSDPFGQKHSYLQLENQQSLSRREVSSPTFVLELGNLQLFEGLIVECFFDLQRAKWIPLRSRPDKRFANSIDVVYANWELIHSPITLPCSIDEAEEMLRFEDCHGGNKEEERQSSEIMKVESCIPKTSIVETTLGNSLYYRELASVDENTKALREFNNYVKRIALQTAIYHNPSRQQGRRLRVVDLAIGRGGDLRKYNMESNAVEHVLGIDINVNNLELCHRRYAQMNFTGPESLSANAGCVNLELLHGSASWSFANSKFWGANSKYMFSSSSTTVAHDPETVITESKAEVLLPKKHSIDIATLHFAMHYFWKTEEDFNNLLANLEFILPVGGYFLATCYDGIQVFDFFTRNDAYTLTDPKTGDIYLQVRPKYGRRGFKENEEESLFGMEIEVFNKSINQESAVSEWLVHPDLFIRKMESIGFRAVSLHEYFGKDCPEFLKPLTRFDYLFWHLYMKWKRQPFISSSTAIPAEQLTTACGWNRLFVFQRMATGPIGDSSLYTPTNNTGNARTIFSPRSENLQMANRVLHKHVKMPSKQTSIKFSNLIHLHPANYYGLSIPMQSVRQTLFR